MANENIQKMPNVGMKCFEVSSTITSMTKTIVLVLLLSFSMCIKFDYLQNTFSYHVNGLSSHGLISNKSMNHGNVTLKAANYKQGNEEAFKWLNVNISNLKFIQSFPKIIHFISISGNINIDNRLNKEHKTNIDAFYRLYGGDGGWKIIVWNNKNVRNVFCLETGVNFEQCDFFMNSSLSSQYGVTLSMKMDILRFMIMYKFGGMYFDADFVALRNINDIIAEKIDEHGLIIFDELYEPSIITLLVAYPKQKCVETAYNIIMNTIKLKHLDSYHRTGVLFWKGYVINERYLSDKV